MWFVYLPAPREREVKKVLFTVAATKQENIVSNKDIENSNISLCLKEDDCIYLHVSELSRQKITVDTVDTDGVIIGLYAFWFIDVEELRIELGNGKANL